MNMVKIWATTLAGALVLASSVGSTAALPQAVGNQSLPSLAPMIKQAAPAVVNIAVQATVNSAAMGRFNDPLFQQFFGRPPAPRQTQSAGSGVIVDAKNGYILTNHHVVDGADSITVTLYDDRTMEAKVVGSDAGSDVALIQVDGKNLAQIPLANSDALQVGDFVVAIGNPFGFSNTVTSGIVSGLGRYGVNADGYENFIQTDAAINPGNSGGALLNLSGELVGINTAIVSRSGGNLGIGFAIPINMARSVMDQILEYGQVRRGLLGVDIAPVNRLRPEVRENMNLDVDYGAIVLEVMPGSAADKAGIQIEDVVIAVNGEKTRNAAELRNTIGLLREGDKVKIDLIRKGKNRTVTANLGSRAEPRSVQASQHGELHPGLEGATFAEVAPNTRSRGVVVSEVAPGSPAALRDVRAGDIITHVNRIPIDNLSEFQRVASNEAAQLMMTVVRDGASRLVIIS